MSSPYISVVVAARNDDEGGNMLRRMQAFLNAWIGQSNKYELQSEIIIVEWNPPADRPRLIESLRWPADKHPCEVRVIEVPREVHRRFENADAISLHQMVAKNVGIRRARGEFVLATNPDIIFSGELMQFLAERRLERRRMYRVDRHDVASEISTDGTVDELLALCNRHILRVFAREGVFEFAPDGLRKIEKQDIVEPYSGIRFGPGWFPVALHDHEPFRFVENAAEVIFQKPPLFTPQLFIDAEIGPSAGGKPLIVEIVDATGLVLTSAKVEGRCELLLHIPEHLSSGAFRLRIQGGGLPLTHDVRLLNLCVFGIRWREFHGRPTKPSDPAWILKVLNTRPVVDQGSSQKAASAFAADMRDPVFLHTYACGDFTMLARDDWFVLRGYPEFPIWPRHIDSLFCYAAHHAGIREIILREPMRVFRIQSSAGAERTSEGDAHVQSKGVSEIDDREWVKWIDQMRRFNAPMIFTKENWGLADMALPETVL